MDSHPLSTTLYVIMREGDDGGGMDDGQRTVSSGRGAPAFVRRGSPSAIHPAAASERERNVQHPDLPMEWD
jgi:hypothetical protein